MNYQGAGSMQANGTAASPIVFTSNVASPVAGSWRGLFFGKPSTSQSSSLTYATVEYGGVASTTRAGVSTAGGTVLLDHLTVRTNLVAGIYITDGNLTVTNCTISGNSGPGIYSMATLANTIGTDTITGNSGYAVSLPGTAPVNDLTALTASGNGTGRDVIELRGGTVRASMTLVAASLPYVVNGTLSVEGPTAPVLTIQPGTR